MSERRAYDASARRARAAERRDLVLATARRRFLQDGYGATSLAGLARETGVSTEYLHKTFGGKAGLVRAIYEQSLLGSGPVPAPERSDEAQEMEPDARALMRRFGSFVAEVTPLGAPIHLLIRDAAAGGDATMLALRDEIDRDRYERMLHNARRMEARGFLRPGLTAEHVADLFWAVTGSDLYESLVLKRGWPPDRFASFIGDTFAAAVLG